MRPGKLLAVIAAASLISLPVVAQTSTDTTERNGHHYQGEPKTVVPHHMGKMETGGKTTTTGQAGTHRYIGGPASSIPHDMSDKKGSR